MRSKSDELKEMDSEGSSAEEEGLPEEAEGGQGTDETVSGATEGREGFGWYAVHTYSGYEKSVEKAIGYLRDKFEHQDKIDRIYVPCEVVKSRRADGAELKRERALFSGYVFLRMQPDPEVVKLLSGAPKVIGFVRAGDELQSFSEEEMAAIEESKEQRRRAGPSEVPFAVGDRVRIVEGLFAPFCGAVEDVTPAKKRLKVTVGIFGRPIPVELSFDQVELAEDED